MEVAVWAIIAMVFCVAALLAAISSVALIFQLVTGDDGVSEGASSYFIGSNSESGYASVVLLALAILFAVCSLRAQNDTKREVYRFAAIVVAVGFVAATALSLITVGRILLSPIGLSFLAIALFWVPCAMLLLSAFREPGNDAKRASLISSTMLSMAVISICLAISVPMLQLDFASNPQSCSCEQCATSIQ